MGKENTLKDSPVMDALKKLKEEEIELLGRLKPVQEAIAALEKIVDKNSRKTKPVSAAKENATETTADEEINEESTVEA